MIDRLRIVIADDEADIRHGLRRLLTKLDYEVVGEAASGRDLVERCRSEKPDVVITDIRMPGLSGIDAAVEIAKTQDVPVIVVSSYERPRVEDSAPIAHFLLKPVSMLDLQAAISSVCFKT